MLKRTYWDAIRHGDDRARNFISERTEGKVSQPFIIDNLKSNATEDLRKLMDANLKALQDATHNPK
jgi:hypothetical protein